MLAVRDSMRIFYHLSGYVSHRLSGLEYAACLRSLGHEVTHDPEAAAGVDAAILHDEPPCYGPLLDRFPVLLRTRRIAFCVWEGEILPDSYRQGLAHVHGIWTPSSFSLQSLRPHFPFARVLPHVVRRQPVSPGDLAFASEALAPAAGSALFLAVLDAANPRKNLEGLLGAFTLAGKMSRRSLCLVIKQYRRELDLSAFPGVISLSGELTAGRMAALYRLCDACVSAHHAEGWGLSLSEAMACGKPVIATGWSGNMDFMDEDNSLPVPYTLVPVPEAARARLPLIPPGSRWASADMAAFADAMKRVAEGRLAPELPERAALVVSRFGPEAVAGRLRELLDER